MDLILKKNWKPIFLEHLNTDCNLIVSLQNFSYSLAQLILLSTSNSCTLDKMHTDAVSTKCVARYTISATLTYQHHEFNSFLHFLCSYTFLFYLL